MADEKPNCKVVLANNIAKSLLTEVQDGLKKIDRKPLLVGFLSSADPAARVYADWTGKTCTEK
jgi:methylenetetrahydrofolate dehydrogenase (NAD+)